MPTGPVSELLRHLPPGLAGPILVLGAGRWAVSEQLEQAGYELEVVRGDWPTIQRRVRHSVVVAEPTTDDAAAVLHCAVQHLEPGGCVITPLDGSGVDDPADRFDLVELGRVAPDGAPIGVLQRTERRTIHDVVFEVRDRIDRVDPVTLADRLAGDDPPTVVDTRTATDRLRFGVIDGSIHAPRTVLEWHLDPANGYRHPAIRSLDQPIVIVCNGGYSSSLAAASLLDLGFTDVGDLIGGVRAWVGAGLPVVEPDHTHLDL